MKKGVNTELAPLASICVVVAALVSHAAEPSRTAEFEDASGVKTEVTELQCSFPGITRFSSASDCIGITASNYQIAIPVSRVISITCSGNKAEVSYAWRGQQRTISGTLEATFIGNSDFGGFALDSSKLRHLSFADKPAPEGGKQPYGTPFPASITLTNGTSIHFFDLQRHASYYLFGGHPFDGLPHYNYYSDFRFMRGESLATLDFAAIRKLEFSAGDGVTVSLKNGNTTSGKLSSSEDNRVDGWTGETEQGLVFLSRSLIRSVEFGEFSTSEKKSK
jgi:hypothetical protein